MTSIDFKSRIASNLQLVKKKKKKKTKYLQASTRKKAKTRYPYNNFFNINLKKLSNHIYIDINIHAHYIYLIHTVNGNFKYM